MISLQSNLLKNNILLVLLGLALVFSTACRRALPEESPAGPPQTVENDVSEEVEPDSMEEESVDRVYYVLYLKHRDQPFIFSDTYSIREDAPELENSSLAAFVVEQLINQQGVGELVNPIPPETQLLSILQDGRSTTVNLSSDFSDNMTGSIEDTEATIAMVVNSLITLPGIDRVILQIDGEIPSEINGLAIRGVYEFVTDYYPDK
ncbi:GerMN domain-containing protein [Anoxynatronum buryatiense]|uniref:Sporulation and spore germination n=1 Tax=Anoxynatronum buryatiense TaxID=489973 RepID=A0AA45WSH7_9CLOT|nr:GerMN domain-containing protein [Anoxynatronum buryatiense]SMP37708.1 Sporulation and spore germination [Anoxynatronum buryatiense]